MATATKSQSKTSFVKEFLTHNPQGNVRAVNEAWKAARMKGTIGGTLIQKLRSEMGLVGNLSATSKPKPAAMATTAVKAKAARTSKPIVAPGKSMFAKEFLIDNPQGNPAAVNKAWKAAGFKGKISDSVVNAMRASLGLAGNLRGTTTKTSVAKETAAKGQPRSNGAVALNDLEGEIDRLMFKVMAMGDFTEIEDSLRQARRLLYAALNRG